MGAPLGNQNNRKAKPWAEALNRALETHRPADQRLALDALAKSLVAKAMDGDIPALKEIGDRLDGKPTQQTEISGLDGGTIYATINRVITDPSNRDSEGVSSASKP